MLDRDVPDDIEFEVGQPVSVGLSYLKIGSGEPYLREVSIVPARAVKGAEITERSEIKPTAPPPRATADPAREVTYGGPIIRRYFETEITVLGSCADSVLRERPKTLPRRVSRAAMSMPFFS